MRILLSLLVVATLSVSAQNPIVRNQFTADPTARVFNGRVYLYPSHDIPAPSSVSKIAGHQASEWFCMADYHVFSSDNLTDWQDHGVIVSQEQVPWGKPDAYSMWAPDCVEKGGKYYFYFPNAPKSGRGFAIGVATADSPTGPFRIAAEPIRGVMGIDPCVLVDNDGTAYLYWSGMGIRGARLKDNMTELDGELETVTFPQGGTMQVGGQQMQGLPDGFKEGPFAFRRGDWYYLTFPWVRKEKGTETLAYAMSRSPLGPWDFKGVFMAEHADSCWTNHHSFVEYQGQWYLFYHHNDYSPLADKRRSACVERVTFRKDGTIQEVKPTLRGVGTTKATARMEVDRYSAASEGTAIAALDTLNRFKGWFVTLPHKGSQVRYDDVDYAPLRAGAYAVVQVRAKANSSLMLSAGKKQIARIPVTVITERGGFRRDQSNQWLTLTAPLTALPKGIADITVTCDGEAVDVDWVQLRNRPEYYSEVSAGAAPLAPDAEGFIRRWTLLEPVHYEVRSNIMLTESYLKDMVAKEWKKVNWKKGKWHTIDSRTYNVRAFRFAELTGNEPYHSLFWGTTVIDCPQELQNVRLAVGSNGASCWWLDNQPVLTLDGDRRMVQDDGVSPRLTLKAGRNVLRFCLVNGPGLSDFCVRFIDEKGNPVLHYTIIR
jgi:hypothetical protein